MSDYDASFWPQATSLLHHLDTWRGANAFEIPLTDRRGRPLGNHGDTLMYQVYREIVGASGLSWTSNVSEADVLLLPPNGALLDAYSGPELLRERLAALPDLPLVILPSSAYFRHNDPASMFGERRSPTLWLLREEESHSHLLRRWASSLAYANVTLKLDHDVVASGHTSTARILKAAAHGRARTGGTLVAARLDVEAERLPINSVDSSLLKRTCVLLFKHLPIELQRLIRRRVTSSRQGAANQHLLQLLNTCGSDSGQEPLKTNSISVDISSPTLVDFSGYAAAILGADLVITNRLHVALPSASVGNMTFLVDSGYHKLRGVYNRSLAALPNVVFVERR